ncbi:restriction endonuclease subunit S, partial [Vibrio anguillarum]|nr:restriction endonuclease subunit S [Vibrio anguillarum]
MITKSLLELSVSISSGLTPLRSNSEFWGKGTIPWLKTEQLGEKYIYETNEHISTKALDQTSIKIFPENSLSIAMYGEGKTRGNLSILRKPMATNQACCNVVVDPQKADFEYVYYFLKTQYEELRNLSSGVRKNLN